jgi:hypothetical protein
MAASPFVFSLVGCSLLGPPSRRKLMDRLVTKEPENPDAASPAVADRQKLAEAAAWMKSAGAAGCVAVVASGTAIAHAAMGTSLVAVHLVEVGLEKYRGASAAGPHAAVARLTMPLRAATDVHQQDAVDKA